MAKLATADASLLCPIHHRTQERELALSVRRLAVLQPALRSAPVELLPEVAFVAPGVVNAGFEPTP